MTEICVIRGDNPRFEIAIQDDVGADFDLTGAVVEFLAKDVLTDPDDCAFIRGYSYPSGLINPFCLDEGKSLLNLTEDEYGPLENGCYCYLVRTYQRCESVATGTATVTNGSGTIVIDTGDISAVKDNALIVLTSANPENGDTFIVDPDGSGGLVADYTGWVDEGPIPFEIFRALIDVPQNLCDKFKLKAC